MDVWRSAITVGITRFLSQMQPHLQDSSNHQAPQRTSPTMVAKRLPEKRDHCNLGTTSFFGLGSCPPTPSGSPRTGSHSHFHQASGLPPDCNGLQPGEIDVFSLYLPRPSLIFH